MSVGRPAGGRRKMLRAGGTGGTARPAGRAAAQPRTAAGPGPVSVTGSDDAAGESDADRAITMMYRAHYRGLVRLAVLLAGDLGAAEAVVQEAFAAMHRDWVRLRDEKAALSFLHRSVVTGSRALAPGPALAVAPRYPVPADGPGERALKAVPLQAAGTQDAAVTVTAEVTFGAGDAWPARGHDQAARPGGSGRPAGPGRAGSPESSGVIPALLRLPEPQREALALRLYLDLRDDQIADAMQVTQAAARGHVNNGLAALRGVA